MFGETLEPELRVYLAGRVSLEAPGGALVEQGSLPGRQGRLVLAYLLVRRVPVPREEMAEVLWPHGPPPSWETALSAVVSKLRRLLRGLDLGSEVIGVVMGCYELRLPKRTWIDLEAAGSAVHLAEAALQAKDYRAVFGASSVAYHITSRTFLAGDSGTWIEQQRDQLRSLRVRAAECLALVSLVNSEPSLAAALSAEVIEMEPFRETAYQLLMRSHAASGNRAEALLVYERCRRLLVEELGADPSPETQALHLELLASAP